MIDKMGHWGSEQVLWKIIVGSHNYFLGSNNKKNKSLHPGPYLVQKSWRMPRSVTSYTGTAKRINSGHSSHLFLLVNIIRVSSLLFMEHPKFNFLCSTSSLILFILIHFNGITYHCVLGRAACNILLKYHALYFVFNIHYGEIFDFGFCNKYRRLVIATTILDYNFLWAIILRLFFF